MAKRQSKTQALFARYFQPLLDALRELGGSGRPSEVIDRIIDRAKTDPILRETLEKSGVARLGNQVHWARFHIARAGYLDSSKRGVWALTEKGRTNNIDSVAAMEIIRESNESAGSIVDDDESAEPPQIVGDYKARALDVLLGLPPKGFENLCQRVLRESGFEEVNVTGRSGDGGIDGEGVLRLNAFVSFRVLFQCKRYRDAVSPDKIRDFRGAMVGRADKGIIITTSRFSQQAQTEASRDGAQPIELVDGEELIDLLAELELGLKPVTTYELDDSFFSTFRET